MVMTLRMSRAHTDAAEAFCAHGHVVRDGRPGGPLAGTSFAVKDLFDVAGVPTGAGSPDWLATHAVPATDADVVARLLEAGARLVGKTQTDEHAWSLTGQNAHYGTPYNSAAPNRIPGGSSSGSAAVTAAGLVDFAIGSDTGGSVRLPASFCGLYGMRPTWGRISLAGAVALAPSYDTVGWFAREPKLLSGVGKVLLGQPAAAAPPVRRLVVAVDLFYAAGDAVRRALSDGIARLSALVGQPDEIVVAGGALAEWRDAFRVLQSAEAWRTHGEWVLRVRPNFGPGVRERFAAAATLGTAEIEQAATVREGARRRMAELLSPGTVMLLPSAPGVAPLRTADVATFDALRANALALLCPAGHAGLPQLSMPLGAIDGAPVGLSMTSASGSDERLLELAVQLATVDG
jgi:amidase